MNISFVGEPFNWLPRRADIEIRPYIIKTEDLDKCKAIFKTQQ